MQNPSLFTLFSWYLTRSSYLYCIVSEVCSHLFAEILCLRCICSRLLYSFVDTKVVDLRLSQLSEVNLPTWTKWRS